jgi:carbonic anhydrase
VFQSMSDLLSQSEIIRHHVAEGKVRLIGGVYTLASGAVNWLGQHPSEAALLAHVGEVTASADRKHHGGHVEHHDDGSAFTSAHPDGVEPRESLARLIMGNLRFADDPIASVSRPNRSIDRRTLLAKGQRPWASVLTCSDSRLAPEHLFDAGLGDLFVVRVAGNVADIDEIGSLEYAVGHLKTPLIIVLGHTGCGAVTAACSGGELPGHLPGLLDNMESAVERASHRAANQPDAKINQAIRENVYQSMSDLLTQSGEIMAYVQAGAVKIVGGVYHLKTGRIEWLGEHPEQTSVVATLLADQKLGIHLEEVTAHGSKSIPSQSHTAPAATPAPAHGAEQKPAPKEKSEAKHDSHGAETTAKKPHH